MARRPAKISAKELAKARKHEVSGPNSSHMLSGTGKSSLKQFPLMELPREVRDMIYEECLALDGAIFVKDMGIRRTGLLPFCLRQREDFDRQMPSIKSSATAEAQNLFYVSKQIRDEAVPIFYRKNTFEFTSLTEMEKFICNMGLKNQHNLRSVIVYYEAEFLEYERPLRLLARCVGLRNLTLVLCDAWIVYRNKDDGAELQKLPAFETLLRIRGLDNVRLVLGGSMGDYLVWASDNSFEKLPAMEAAVQVMKQPRLVPQMMKRNKVKGREQEKRKSAFT